MIYQGLATHCLGLATAWPPWPWPWTWLGPGIAMPLDPACNGLPFLALAVLLASLCLAKARRAILLASLSLGKAGQAILFALDLHCVGVGVGLGLGPRIAWPWHCYALPWLWLACLLFPWPRQGRLYSWLGLVLDGGLPLNAEAQGDGPGVGPTGRNLEGFRLNRFGSGLEGEGRIGATQG